MWGLAFIGDSPVLRYLHPICSSHCPLSTAFLLQWKKRENPSMRVTHLQTPVGRRWWKRTRRERHPKLLQVFQSIPFCVQKTLPHSLHHPAQLLLVLSPHQLTRLKVLLQPPQSTLTKSLTRLHHLKMTFLRIQIQTLRSSFLLIHHPNACCNRLHHPASPPLQTMQNH